MVLSRNVPIIDVFKDRFPGYAKDLQRANASMLTRTAGELLANDSDKFEIQLDSQRNLCVTKVDVHMTRSLSSLMPVNSVKNVVKPGLKKVSDVIAITAGLHQRPGGDKQQGIQVLIVPEKAVDAVCKPMMGVQIKVDRIHHGQDCLKIEVDRSPTSLEIITGSSTGPILADCSTPPTALEKPSPIPRQKILVEAPTTQSRFSVLVHSYSVGLSEEKLANLGVEVVTIGDCHEGHYHSVVLQVRNDHCTLLVRNEGKPSLEWQQVDLGSDVERVYQDYSGDPEFIEHLRKVVALFSPMTALFTPTDYLRQDQCVLLSVTYALHKLGFSVRDGYVPPPVTVQLPVNGTSNYAGSDVTNMEDGDTQVGWLMLWWIVAFMYAPTHFDFM